MNVVTIFYRKKIIVGTWFIASSLSNLDDNLAEGIHKIICKDCHYFFLKKIKYKSANENLTNYKFLSCNKTYWEKTEETFKDLFKNTFKLSNNIG